MKKYHIYGIGNALVDIEVEVSEENLKQLEIEKGIMTLVDEERQNFLLDALPGTHHHRACGGSAANSVIGAAKLGAKTFYSCKIANDEMGTFYAEDLEREGVNSNLTEQTREAGHTGRCIVMVTPDADRTMNTHLGITGDLGFEQVDEQALNESEWLYIEGYLVSTDAAREAAMKTKQIAESKGLKVAMSFSDLSMVKFFHDGLKDMVGTGVDILFCNEEEAITYTESSDIERAFDALKDVAKTFAITRGPKGAVLWDGERRIDIDAHKVKAVDTNGAGDLFAGAFLYGITHGFNYETSGRLASFASARLVQEFGPRLSSEGLQLVKNFLKEL
ncbi:adenosine kinase [Pleionea sediminis]|uniref:adenosine kinase n=1 Tax=Pleionea sediminis TaxID=2569479 RepID=UPI001186846D|nr:adenosine kinase [Pleionea sediminis]